MARGFSLVEMLVAVTMMALAAAGLAQALGAASRANRGAHATTVATLLAQQKMEQLRGLLWTVDASGVARSDSALVPSPSGALDRNTPGYCDFADANGHALGGGDPQPAGAIYARRWSIDPLPPNPGNTLVVQVTVTAAGTSHSTGEAHLVTVRTRKAW
jgi:prepilin-type N-terminal cleavage/methylation domain-containing protein